MPPADRLTLAQAWVLLLLADVALRILGFKRLLAVSRKISRRREVPPGAPPSSAARLAWLVEVAGRHSHVSATCLEKAIVLSWLLGRRGLATTLRIGVARREGTLAAHAWLEHAGQVILGHPGGDEYAGLFSTAAADR